MQVALGALTLSVPASEHAHGSGGQQHPLIAHNVTRRAIGKRTLHDRLSIQHEGPDVKIHHIKPYSFAHANGLAATDLDGETLVDGWNSTYFVAELHHGCVMHDRWGTVFDATRQLSMYGHPEDFNEDEAAIISHYANVPFTPMPRGYAPKLFSAVFEYSDGVKASYHFFIETIPKLLAARAIADAVDPPSCREAGGEGTDCMQVLVRFPVKVDNDADPIAGTFGLLGFRPEQLTDFEDQSGRCGARLFVPSPSHRFYASRDELRLVRFAALRTCTPCMHARMCIRPTRACVWHVCRCASRCCAARRCSGRGRTTPSPRAPWPPPSSGICSTTTTAVAATPATPPPPSRATRTCGRGPGGRRSSSSAARARSAAGGSTRTPSSRRCMQPMHVCTCASG